MLILTRPRSGHDYVCGPVRGVITLTYEQRTRSRLRARTDDDRDAALNVERGGILRDGDRLRSADGEIILVRAAAESVSAVYCHDALALARVCYHLGNRHVALDIREGRVAYLADHVLDEMVRGLDLDPVAEQAPFEPEGGAYGGHHAHRHDHHDPAGGEHHAHAIDR